MTSVAVDSAVNNPSPTLWRRFEAAMTWRGHSFAGVALVTAGLLLSLAVYAVAANTFQFPQTIIDAFPFADKVNDARDWMEANLKPYTRAVSEVIRVPLEWIEEQLWELPWLFVLLMLVIPALAYGGLKLGLLTFVGVMFWGMVDMWYEAMSTLSLMTVSVMFSVILGVLLGVLASQSDRFEMIIRPVLDTMQTMPAFVYLIPAIFLFGVGATSAAMAVIIYALPPAVRLTNLGIRQVPATMIESAQSFGSSSLQMLFKVKLPQALPSIMLGVNQTIMMALGLAVLAVFIGGGGLGEQVWKAITRLKVGWAFEGGICIVFLAIILDRLSYAISGVANEKRWTDSTANRFHLLPQKWDSNPLARAFEYPLALIWNTFGSAGTALTRAVSSLVKPLSVSTAQSMMNRPFLIVGGLLLLLLYFFGGEFKWMSTFPRDWEFSLREPIDAVINWLTINPTFIGITKAIRATIYLYLLNPLDMFLSGLPWWYLMPLIALIVWASVSWQFALVTLVFLFFTAAAGLWEQTLFTLAGTSVSVIICMLVGVPVGVAAAYSKVINSVVQPVLDAMQTLPAFVYLIPALFFFGGNKTTAIIATVIYAVPPVIRLTTLGLKQVPEEVDEVAGSFGSSTLQTLIKVKLPMASPSIILGLNQAVVFALAMQAITPLIGGLGLGKEVFDAMNVSNLGKGLAGGIGIVLLTIVLDRVTQGWTKNQRKALGL
jgi:glycine betaine/proline transport system permease protein